MCLLATNTKEWNIERREQMEIEDYNAQRIRYVNQYTAGLITADTLDSLERDLSAAHLERLRKIRKGY
jgi:hypothetical protein